MARSRSILAAATCSFVLGACFTPDSDLGATETDGGSDSSAGSAATTDSGPDPSGGSAMSDTDGPATATDTTMPGMDDGTATDDGTSATDDGATDDTGSPPMCGAGTSCAPDVPAGWSGPAMLYVGTDEPPTCPAGAPELVVSAGMDLSAPAADCGCECGAATGFDCTVDVTEAGSVCGNLVFNPETFTLESGQCTTTSTNDSAFSTNSPSLDVSGAQCDPQESATVPPAGFGTHVAACQATSMGECADGSCVADDAGFDQVCVYTGGDVECPAGPYTEREVAFNSWTDTRDCSTCTCDDPTGTCGGTVAFRSSCGGVALPVLYGTVDPPGCGNASQDPPAMIYNADPDVECAPSGGDPIGQATPSGPVTICCLP